MCIMCVYFIISLTCCILEKIFRNEMDVYCFIYLNKSWNI